MDPTAPSVLMPLLTMNYPFKGRGLDIQVVIVRTVTLSGVGGNANSRVYAITPCTLTISITPRPLIPQLYAITPYTLTISITPTPLSPSVRYHSLHPDYIHCRLKELGKQYELRILLVYVDTTESHHALQELTKMALLADLTLILAWSPEEAARYLETYKAYENKPPDLIMERTDSDFSSRVIDSLTTVKKVNKTDAATLLNNFKTMEKLVQASKEELTMCPGLGPQKAQRLYDLFHEPFLRTKKKSKTDL
ncbi:DNA excision repair protein ERCC-1-like [Halichondria panicea]|uniref:DNA excision repair protein ERCC-1-like n=1 Tax=Halichondria panicea TaxID=6063 RepID=UPI00312B3678